MGTRLRTALGTLHATNTMTMKKRILRKRNQVAGVNVKIIFLQKNGKNDKN
jgi:hypothetical protein